MPSIKDKIELSTSIIFFDDSGILRVEYKDDCEMDVEKARDHAAACCELCQGIPRLFVIDVRNKTGNITNDARDFLA
ncbi:MAG: hypothetical protein JKY42_09790 [Flavobacteriales bacterium]|nr:hypothetical protein [Flavobacteriales bacterium]